MAASTSREAACGSSRPVRFDKENNADSTSAADRRRTGSSRLPAGTVAGTAAEAPQDSRPHHRGPDHTRSGRARSATSLSEFSCYACSDPNGSSFPAGFPRTHDAGVDRRPGVMEPAESPVSARVNGRGRELRAARLPTQFGRRRDGSRAVAPILLSGGAAPSLRRGLGKR
jgi:hypothetical protein